MRTKEEGLRACPICASEVTNLGLRDYSSWADFTSHGKMGGTDMDRVKERRGHFIAWEFKNSKFIPKGQAIFFDSLAQQENWTVYIVVDRDAADNEYLVGRWVPGRFVPVWTLCSRETIARIEDEWFEEVESL